MPTGFRSPSLVYAADGDLMTLEGREIAGRIVLIDYASDRGWVDLFHLEAQAVIFLKEEGPTERRPSRRFWKYRRTCPGSMRPRPTPPGWLAWPGPACGCV